MRNPESNAGDTPPTQPQSAVRNPSSSGATLAEKLAEMDRRYDELHRLIGDPAAAENRARYQAILKELGGLQKIIPSYREFKNVHQQALDARAIVADPNADADLKQLAAEELATLEKRERELTELIRRTFASDTGGMQRNCILEIRAGTGGEEAALFAAELLRLYAKYAEREGLKTHVLDSSPTALGGLKEVIVGVEGSGAYGKFRWESGGHRVQRVPETEAGGRIHTSLVTVAVLAEPEEVEIQINPADVKVDVYRSSGPGGQNVNKTSSAVRMTHIPTGLVAQCQDSPSQHKNRATAWRVLRSRLYEVLESQQREERDRTRRKQMGTGDRSDKIRTYNFPQNRVTDHRINLTLHNLQNVMEGEIQEIVDGLNKHELAEKESELSIL